MNEPPPSGRSSAGAASAFAAAVLALGAAWAGGATERWSQAAVFQGFGLLLLLAPPRRWPPRWLALPAIGLLALGALAFLPAGWFHLSTWRPEVVAAGIRLGSQLSPQPELSREALLLLAVGCLWAAWLNAREWSPGARSLGLRTLALGFITLAAATLVARLAQYRVPGWLSENGFGPFPNRNHTSHVLALGGLLALGCAGDAARHGWQRGGGWVLGAAVALAGLVMNFSRGGVLIFFGGCAIWIGITAWQRRSWKTLAIGGSGLLTGIAIVLFFGGALAGRFAGGQSSEIAFRPKIWRDTLGLIGDSPWCGAGLGNFAALFPFHRSASVIQQTILHPESDWLWLAAELGWLAVLLAAWAIGRTAWEAFPFPTGTQRRLRAAAAATGIAAALHGLVDVPGHRLGCILPALFILAAAKNEGASHPPIRRVSLVWRAAGLALWGAAFWWQQIPDDATRATKLAEQKEFIASARAATSALAAAPLDWSMYFTRAGDLANLGKIIEAKRDFERARLLDPHFVDPPMTEGKFWARRLQFGAAIDAWREVLRRAGPENDEAQFKNMFDKMPETPAFHRALWELAQETGPELMLAWIQIVPDNEARPHLDEAAEAASHCDAPHRAAFERRRKALVESEPPPP